ncbi:MAG: DegV domain-containing protein [Chloroflexi bacterium ADurb.Bin325]|nr:MAG: DegV domain-containing protein [Chloroflexi bacterium ADurb.Bin325]
MIIVTDRGADLSPQQMQGLSIHFTPLTITLDGRSYVSGVDIQPEEFYALLASTDSMPTTSLPSPGEFIDLYRELAKLDPEIVSVHISSGLSGTAETARAAAAMVPEAHITVIDTFTLSGAEGWQVEAAARAARAGWSVEQIRALLEQVRDATETVFTLPELKYLIHGGRISHLKGLLASILNIKPIIGVSKTDGKYYQRSRARSFNAALAKLVQVAAEDHAPGTALRVQVMHANNPEGAEELRRAMAAEYDCEWLPTTSIAPVLGAHTGAGLVGMVYAARAAYPAIP